MKTIAFFNNKGGVGKTSLVYHLAWMYAEMGQRVIAADLDPQSNLTSMCLSENRLEELWPDEHHPYTIKGMIDPILRGLGDVSNDIHIEQVDINFGLITGDLGLSKFEDKLSEQWPKCSDGDESAFRVLSAFYRILHNAAQDFETDLVLIDVGPNLGAINRSAIIAADYIVIPLAPDLYSIQGLQNLGPTIQNWRKQWKERILKNPEDSLILPKGNIEPVGYIVLQHAIHQNKPVKAYEKWIRRIPAQYRNHVLDEPEKSTISVEEDNHCLAMIKHYRSLMPMAMEVKKPLFHLKPADGAIGSHMQAVHQCYSDFEILANKIRERCFSGLSLSTQ